MASRVLFLQLLHLFSAFAFKTDKCDHDKVTSVLALYNDCTMKEIKPAVQSLAMKAGDPVDNSAVQNSCDLLKKTGPIMKCANDTLGQCFEQQDINFNLKLGGQHAALLSMKCDADEEDQMVVENDIFFSWLELEGLHADGSKETCTIEAVDNTNLKFQECVMHQDENLVEDTKDVPKDLKAASNTIMKCFDKTDNPCFSEREMSFLRTEFKSSIEEVMKIIWGMGDLNEDEVPEGATVSEKGEKALNSSKEALSCFSFVILVFYVLL